MLLSTERLTAARSYLQTAPLRGDRPDQAFLAGDLVFAEGVCGTQACQPCRRVLKVLPDRIAIVNGLTRKQLSRTVLGLSGWPVVSAQAFTAPRKGFHKCMPDQSILPTQGKTAICLCNSIAFTCHPNRRMPAICCLCRWNLLRHTDCSADAGRLCV
ncbi:hypothetical protein LX32DRAFT_354561 [Colletotrichum zoysiae]|uniref:Uncharacterized protein n=1 Tax=Colletotrichum zoysiae TaxID=1216348 RepID=A0AAD9HI01_9PEZI|nr:hypothetical protein LX32DRAFT_354561 [Colletotrichum zoysiae]